MIQRFINKINTLLSWFGFVSVLVLVFLIAHDVFMRYIFNRPTLWTTEVAMGFQIFFGFLCAGYVLKEGGHIRMDALLISVSEKTRLFLFIITSILGFCMSCIFVYYFWLSTAASFRMNERTGVLEHPVFILKGAAMIGFLLLGIQFIAEIAKCLQALRATKINQ